MLGVSAALCVLSSFESPFPDGPSGCWGVFKSDCYIVTIGVRRSVLHCAMRTPRPCLRPLPRPQRTGGMLVATLPQAYRPWPSPYLAASVFLQPSPALRTSL